MGNQSVTMELPGNHRRGCCAASMEGVCHGEVYDRVEVLLHVRDGRARKDDHGQGHRQKMRAILYGRGSTRWPPSSRRRTRPRVSRSGTAAFGTGKRRGTISSRHGPGDTFPGRNRPIWEEGMRRRPSTSACRPSRRTASGFGRLAGGSSPWGELPRWSLRAALHVSAGAVTRGGRGHLKLAFFELGGGACVEGAARKERAVQAPFVACRDGK